MRLFTKLALAMSLLSAPLAAESELKSVQAATDFRKANEIQLLNDFRDLLSMPNVSSNLDDMMVNARWIESYLQKRKFSTEIWTAGRAPYVFAERKTPGATKTVLIYAHFDGQPVEPANWKSSPFVPQLRDGMVENDAKDISWPKAGDKIDPEWRLFARSAGDDKAPIIALMAAIDGLDKAGITPSVNIKLILDGEEEAGSSSLEGILAKHSEALASDLMLFCDGPMHQSRRRQLVFGVRGTLTATLTMYGPNKPLHSGHYGNWAPNPSEKLVALLNDMNDQKSVGMTYPGYNDDVTPITAAEQAAIKAMPNMDEKLKDDLNIGTPVGQGSRLELQIMKPAIVLKGLQGGGVGKLARNIIMPTAAASLNFRLVPSQTPERVMESFQAYLSKSGYTVTTQEPSKEMIKANDKLVYVKIGGGYPAFRTSLENPSAQKLVGILDQIDDQKTLLTPTMGGSLPIYLFEQALTAPIVILPVANHDNNQHGRNENLRLQNLWDAIEVYAAVISEF